MECAGIITERKKKRKSLRRTLAYIERRKWSITLLTEIRAESRGILWFGEEESETAVIHSVNTAVVLRGEEIGDGEKKGREGDTRKDPRRSRSEI